MIIQSKFSQIYVFLWKSQLHHHVNPVRFVFNSCTHFHPVNDVSDVSNSSPPLFHDFIFKSPLIIYPESCFPFPSESTNGSFNIKTSSGYKFGCLAKIVNYMKVRFLSTAMTRNCSIVVIVIVIFIYNTKCVLYGIVNVSIFLNTV